MRRVSVGSTSVICFWRAISCSSSFSSTASGATRMRLPSRTWPSCFCRSTTSSAWSQGTSRILMVTSPLTSSEVTMLTTPTSASRRRMLWMSAPLKSRSMRRPV